MNKRCRYFQVEQLLLAIEQQLQHLGLGQCPPKAQAVTSEVPFCLDTMEAGQWLQWVLLPRMFALLEALAPLPQQCLLTPYFEIAYQERTNEVQPLLSLLRQLDNMLNQDGN